MPARIQRNLTRNHRFADLFKERGKPYLPTHAVRLTERRQAESKLFEDMCASGVAFTPEERLPPWKRRAAMLEATQVKKPAPPQLKVANIKLRIAAPGGGDTNGFPTHFH